MASSLLLAFCALPSTAQQPAPRRQLLADLAFDSAGWQISSVFAPAPVRRSMAVGVHNGSIYLIGGHNGTGPVLQVAEYHIAENSFASLGDTISSHGLVGHSQFDTQLNDTVFIIDLDGEHLNAYHLSTNTFESAWQNVTIPVNVAPDPPISVAACITHTDTHLIIIGGGNVAPLADVQVLHLPSMTWLSNVSSMTVGRFLPSCNAHAATSSLYVIGGHSYIGYQNTVEKLYFGENGEGFVDGTWTVLPDTVYTVAFQRSVIVGNHIVIIGGFNGTAGTKRVQTIDVLTDEINQSAGSLQFVVWSSGVAVVDGVLYSFAGATNGGYVSWWQYSLLEVVPTSSPTGSPSAAPTNSPTAPSAPPTLSPSAAPTSAPTTCYEGNTWSNDGFEQTISAQIANLHFEHTVSDPSRIIVADANTPFLNRELTDLHDDIKQQLECIGTAACLGASVHFDNNTICNVLCNDLVSCTNSLITINNCRNAHIICNGSNSCDGMMVQIGDTLQQMTGFRMDCGVSSSCNSVSVSIARTSATASISCFALNACDHLLVESDPANYKNGALTMHSYSADVTFSNGFGYEEEDRSKQYVHCNTNDHFIKYNSSQLGNTDEALLSSVRNEYENDTFPCDGVTIECYSDLNNTNSSCDMHFAVDTGNFSIDSPDPSASCYWVPVSDIIRTSCAGECASSPTYAPTPSPTNFPTAQTSAPSAAPTYSPSAAPSAAPTLPPSTAPTTTPSSSPTAAPSFLPTSAPSTPPSSAPSVSPTVAPSVSPSQSPSATPSFSPTSAPTRFPTDDGWKQKGRRILIEYALHNLSSANKTYLWHNPFVAKLDLEEIIESSYFTPNALSYSDFFVNITAFNEVRIYAEMSSEDADLYDALDPHLPNTADKAVVLSSEIQTDANFAGLIISKSQIGDDTFQPAAERKVQLYLNNNTAVTLSVVNGDELQDEPIFATQTTQKKESETVIIVCIVIVAVGCFASLAAFGFNKLPFTKVDNAKFFMPLLLALSVYDFISDINLSISIFQQAATEQISLDNNLLFVALASLLFVVLPLASNLYYAATISNQAAIKQNPSARAWFGKHLAQFILLCVVSGGTYPVLILSSSRIFGLEFFNSGLLTGELTELSKIKIRSTIYMENIPQLFIQIVYSLMINELQEETMLAAVASLLSIIASLIIFKAQTAKNEDCIETKYWITFSSHNILSEQNRQKLNARKGLKERMQKALCKAFGIPDKSMEVGFVTVNDYGCSIHVQHSVFGAELNRMHSFHSLDKQHNANELVQVQFRGRQKRIAEALVAHFEVAHGKEFAVSFERVMDDDVLRSLSMSYHVAAQLQHAVAIDGARGADREAKDAEPVERVDVDIEMVETRGLLRTAATTERADGDARLDALQKRVDDIYQMLTTQMQASSANYLDTEHVPDNQRQTSSRL